MAAPSPVILEDECIDCHLLVVTGGKGTKISWQLGSLWPNPSKLQPQLHKYVDSLSYRMFI